MKVRRVEHVDDFNEYEHIFWLEVDDVQNQLIELAKEIDGKDFDETCFGMCVQCDGNDWYVCEDKPGYEIFYVDNDGEKHWMEYELTKTENSYAIDYCQKYFLKSGNDAKEINRVSFEIEHYDGNTYMCFMLSIKDDGSVEVVKTYNCDNADVSWDYIFDTENDLYRIQAEEPITEDEFEDIWDCYKKHN